MRQINLIVVHCTASRNGKARPVAAIEADHRARGFSSIGYHYVIQPDGHVDLGRDEEQPGAHAKGFNAHSLGVCLVGGLGGPNRLNPGLYTMAQWDALRITVRSLLDRYPGARVVGHRDLSPDLDGDGQVEPHEWLKKCPAFEVQEWLAGDMLPLQNHVLRTGAVHA
jgi:N-acetylmuramoyl-L-alanine amidase